MVKHPRLIDDMVALDPSRHAILEQATALYRPAQPEEALRTLDLFVADEHVQLIVSVLNHVAGRGRCVRPHPRALGR